jgi:hypothetical protein
LPQTPATLLGKDPTRSARTNTLRRCRHWSGVPCRIEPPFSLRYATRHEVARAIRRRRFVEIINNLVDQTRWANRRRKSDAQY